jgi:prephenate dehydrogenase
MWLLRLVIWAFSPIMVVTYKEAAMFARVKKSGPYQYLQLVENRRENGRVAQRVIATLGRMDQLTEKGSVESIIRC